MAVYDRTNGGLSPGRKWLSRTKQRIANNLGIISGDALAKVRKFRDEDLETLDAYYEGRQYEDKQNWDEALKSEEYVPVRDREPRINYNSAKVIIDRVTAKLIGQSVFPAFNIESDPDDTEYFRQVQRISNFKAEMLEPMRRMLATGSCFVRYSLVDGSPKIEWFHSKYCYPEFQDSGELESLTVKYVYEDPSDKDSRGEPKKKWYRLDLTVTADILYDNPEYKDGTEPEFQVVDQVDHNLGWVQGEWFRTGKDKFKPDGPSIIASITDFIDDLNYSLSQSSQAVGYNQDPQLVVSGVDEDEMDKLIRSSQKAWNLGRADAKAEFLETDLKGVEQATNLRTDSRSRMLEVARVVLMDPEKIGGAAQSGVALAILHAPLVELIDEMRLQIEPMLRNLLIKIGMTLLAMRAQGMEIAVETPNNYMPQSLDITLSWPPIFPPTLQDLLQKVQGAVAAKNAGGISRDTLVRYLAKDFGVEDVEAELQKIEADLQEQAAMNPYGSFGGK